MDSKLRIKPEETQTIYANPPTVTRITGLYLNYSEALFVWSIVKSFDPFKHSFPVVTNYKCKSISRALGFKYLIAKKNMKFLSRADLVKIKLNAMVVIEGVGFIAALQKGIFLMKKILISPLRNIVSRSVLLRVRRIKMDIKGIDF